MTTPTAAPFFIANVEPDGTQCDAWPEQPLLLSMEQGGFDWPSSCRNGTCRTWLGQLVEGTVRWYRSSRMGVHLAETSNTAAQVASYFRHFHRSAVPDAAGQLGRRRG